MARHDNWQTRLGILIGEARDRPFDFPSWNCLLWALADVEAILEVDHGQAYRGKYETEAQALKLLRKVDGVKTPEALLKLKLGGEFQPASHARQGDIVFVDPEEAGLDLICNMRAFGPVPGVCYGQMSLFVGERGLIDVETLRVSKALWVS